jgi:hypothetical protein
MDTLRDRFEEKIDHRDGKQVWTGSVNNIGYPKMKVDGKMRLASHIALELNGRQIPEGKVVMHKDNNPKNLAPSNLTVGTQKQNLKKMRDQGRDRPRGVPQEPDEQVKSAAFMDELVRIIRTSNL